MERIFSPLEQEVVVLYGPDGAPIRSAPEDPPIDLRAVANQAEMDQRFCRARIGAIRSDRRLRGEPWP